MTFSNSPTSIKDSKKYAEKENAVLLDVRTPQEYREGHIPGSKNVPLQTIDKVTSIAENKDTVLYVYCYSGAQSRQATAMLQQGFAGWMSRLKLLCSSGQVIFPMPTAVCLTISVV